MLKDNPAYYAALEDDIDELELSPVLYNDANFEHELSAKALAQHAGVNFRDLGPTDDKKFAALINPELALPAAYQLAVQIYEAQMAGTSDSKELVPAMSPKTLRGLEHRLQMLLEGFMIRTPASGGAINTEALLRQEGEENLGFAVQEEIAKILEKVEREKGYCPLEETDPAVTCEALGRLCEREIKRVQETPALSNDTPDSKLQAGRVLDHERTALPQLEGGHGRGGKKT